MEFRHAENFGKTQTGSPKTEAPNAGGLDARVKCTDTKIEIEIGARCPVSGCSWPSCNY